jgi:murein DD-endopeptidase MepM/ murein hydrolase activator NlpD
MKKTLSSPLVAAANNIVSLGSRSNSLPRFQRDFNSFSRFLEVEKKSLEKLKLPDKKKIRALASLNIASNFGRPGNLLSSLFSGALDLAGFVGNMFPGRGKFGKPQRPPKIKPSIPEAKGPRLKLGGMRAVGVGNALFAGLDFAQGLAEGESVGKATSGAVGSLAGGLLGGAIGQALIPIPGLGFVVGSMAGNFLGGFAADRVYEGGSSLKQKLAERLKGQEAKQKALTSESSFVDSISKFEQSVGKFEEFINKSFASVVNAAAAAAGSDEMMLDYGLDPDVVPDTPELPGQLQEMTAEGGDLPSRQVSSPYGWRWGKLHTGVDYPRPEGTPVSVIQPGQVSYAGDISGYGNAVIVSHPGGLSTLYGHLSKINVSSGQKIEPGTVIGNTGSTGNSTGPHVHFEVRQGRKRLEIPTGEGDKYFRFGGNIKVKPKSGASGKPTAVLMAGTNDYGDPKSGAAGITKAIKELQAKGYDVVVVPPSEQGAYANVSKEVQKSASAAGASIEKGQYNPNDPTRAYTHLLPDSAKAIQSKYKGATFVGDSNAELISGAKSYRGEGANAIADKIKSAVPMAARPKPGIGGAELDQKMLEMYKQGLINQMSSYPSYNQPGGGASVIMPIMMGGGGGGQQRPVYIPVGGGGGGGTVIMPGPTEGQVVNSLMKTMLLTNLSAT